MPHKILQCFVFFCLLAASFNCKPTLEEATTEEATVENELEVAPLLEIDLETAQTSGNLPPIENIEVLYDPVFKRKKQYRAIPLKPFLKKQIVAQNLDTANTEIIFLCKDGYNPSMSLNKVMQHEPYLAIQDLEADNGKVWLDTLQGKWTPFYLVWTNHTEGAKGFGWPYGLKYLQFKASDKAYRAAFPKDKKQIAGFELYKTKCMKCHSVNKVGGVMGPEMNIPKNITEYWKKDDIRAFVKNPYAYRYNSKMPPVVGITDNEIEQIIAYLVYMKGQKL